MFRRLVYLLAFFFFTTFAFAQYDKLEPGDVERGRTILSDVYDAVKKNYYDPKFHDVDLAARYKDASEKIGKAQNFNQMLGIVAWFLEPLNDSHTFLIPPPHAYRLDYGWRAQMIGEKCFITQVRPGTDAEKQSLRPGDELLSVNGVAPTRDTLWKIEYLFNVLRPQPGLRLAVRTPNGEQRTLDIKAMLRPTRKEINAINFWNEVREEERDDQIYKRKSVTIGDDVVVWKLHDWMMDEKGSDNMVHAAKSAHALVLDLRGNGGGSLLAVTRMISNLVDHDVKVADPQGRKKFDLSPVAKTKGNNAFTGKVVVLVDSNSASASEILARVLQLEKRGIIVGDKTAGAVMVAEHFPMRSGLDHTIFYGASVTMWDFVMSDGHSLEHNGVLPDEQLVPTANDLASGRDPVLARAVELAGGKLSAEDAGKLFPYEWPPE